MFNTEKNDKTDIALPASPKIDNTLANAKYKSIIPQSSSFNDLTYNAIDEILENEKIKNKSDPWNKLDKTVKIQKLHASAEKYGKDNGLPVKEIKSLKQFFIGCLEKQKLQKTKDVVYDKTNGSIKEIPALSYTKANKHFTLKNMDKRVSTLKSLAPKKTQGTIKNKNTAKVSNEDDSASDSDDN
jgi:hypothetical protein